MSPPRLGVKRFGPDGRIARIPSPTGFPVGDINTYAILPRDTSGELVLVDTGVKSDASWEALETGLRQVGHEIADIGRVLLTHAHPDHFGHAARIARTAGCQVWAHEAAQASIDRYAGGSSAGEIRGTNGAGRPAAKERVSEFLRSLGVPNERAERSFGPPGGQSIVEYLVPDVSFRDGDRIEVADFPLEVVHTPGHCPEEVVFWHAESGSMFAGDHLLPDITPVCLFDIPVDDDTERVHTLVQYHASLDKVEPLPVKLLLPSHGDILRSHRDLLARYRLLTDSRALKIARILSRAEATPFAIAVEMFPKVWDAQLHLVLSEVLGHLDLLVERGHARHQKRDGVFQYAFVSLPDTKRE